MDKFGIFRLLSALSGGNFDKNQNGENTAKQELINQNNETNNGFSLNNLFGGQNLQAILQNLFPKQNTAKNNQGESGKQEKQEIKPPALQEQMLSTMKSHDEIIKRVAKNNNLKL